MNFSSFFRNNFNSNSFANGWLFGGKNLSSANNAALNAAIGAAGALGGTAISNGYNSDVGSAFSSLGNIASSIPGPWGAALGLGLNVVGGLANRAFGAKWNLENINRVEGNINTLKNFLSNAGSWDLLLSNIETMPAEMTFSNSFIGKNGWFNHKADRKAERLRNDLSLAFGLALRAVTNNAGNIATNQAQTLARNYASYGGPINLLGDGVMSPFGSRFAKGGMLNNPLSSNGADWNIGLTSINNGGRHELNPYEGVLIGVDLEGTPNLVEEGEVIWNDYVFSNRMKVPKALREQLKLGNRDITYAEAVKSKKKEREERPNDPIEKRGFEAFLQRLGDSQEEQRLRQEARRAEREARKALALQAIMGALGLLSPMDAMQLQGIPDGLMMALVPLQPMEQGYAHGGPMGNMFDGWGSYWNGIEPYSPYKNITDKYFSILEGNNSDEGLDIDKINDPIYLNQFKYVRNNLLNPRLSLLVPTLNIPTINKPAPIRYVYEPLGETPKYFYPKLDKNNNPIKGQGAYNEGFQDFVNSLTDEKLNKIYTSNPSYRELFSEGKFPSLADTQKAALDKNPGNIYNILSRYYYENDGRPIKKDALGNPMTKPLYNNIYGINDNGRPYVYNMNLPLEKANFEEYRDKLYNDWVEDKFTYKPFDERIKEDFNKQISDWAEGKAESVIPDKYNVESQEYEDEGGGGSWLANLRYLPALGNTISVFSDLMGWTNKPDYSNANAVLEASRGIRDVRFNPIGDYLTYRPLDRMFALNLLNAQTGATLRNIINTSGNRGTALAGLLASGYNANNTSGNLFRLALEYNEAQRQLVANFNRETNKFNSQMDLEALRANLGASEVRMNAALNAARLRDAIDERAGLARSANLTNFFDSIGDIGREEFTRNMINSNRALYYTIDRQGGIHYKSGFYSLPKWERDYYEEEANRRSRDIQNNGSRRRYSNSNGGYLTIKRR